MTKDIKKYLKERYDKIPFFNNDYFKAGWISLIFGLVGVLFTNSMKPLESENMLVNFLDLAESTTILIFVMGILSFINAYLTRNRKEQISGELDSRPIYSLKSGVRQEGIKGDFFLGCGSISGMEQEDYYVFYEEGEFGLIKSKEYAKDLEVIQRDDIEPSIKTVLVDGKERRFLIVPKNTIKQRIKLDL